MIKSLFKCMYSHRLLVVGMILAPKSRCSVPGSFEDETLLICIIYIQEKVHQSIPNADTGLPWCTWCWNSSLVYSFNIKLQVSGSSWWGGVVWFSCTVTSEEYWNSLTFDSAYRPRQMSESQYSSSVTVHCARISHTTTFSPLSSMESVNGPQWLSWWRWPWEWIGYHWTSSPLDLPSSAFRRTSTLLQLSDPMWSKMMMGWYFSLAEICAPISV